MYILHRVEYADRRIDGETLRAAWASAGLEGSPPSGGDFGPADLRAIFDGTLVAAGAIPSGADGRREVPRSAVRTLERLEAFYQRLYPEFSGSRSRHHFHYEEVEWLGEF